VNIGVLNNLILVDNLLPDLNLLKRYPGYATDSFPPEPEKGVMIIWETILPLNNDWLMPSKVLGSN
jgi:hypothetical protein